MSAATQIILQFSHSRLWDGWSGERRAWGLCKAEVLRRLAPAELALAETTAEAAALARESALLGYRRIIAAGGDAVIHGVVNGLMGLTPAHRQALQVGLFTLGFPGAFSRTLDLPTRLGRQLDLLQAAHTLPCDVIRADFQGMGGEPDTRYFLSGARIGGLGNRTGWADWERAPTPKREAVELARHLTPPPPAALRLEGEGVLLHEGPAPLVMVMGGRHYPGMGEVSPGANQGDGLLDVAWLEGAGGLRRVSELLRVALPAPLGRGMRRWRSLEELRVSAADGKALLELDRQPAGLLPVTFTVERRALPLIVESVAVRWRQPMAALARNASRGGFVGSVRRDGLPAEIRRVAGW